MEQKYALLDTTPLPQAITFHHPEKPMCIIHDDSPALEAMVDYQRVSPETIPPKTSTQEALDMLTLYHAKGFMVVGEHDEILGVVTARDLHGVKPTRIASQNGLTPAEIQVQMVMTPRSELHSLAYKDLSNARVGHIVRLLHEHNSQHIFVTEENEDGQLVVRGMFSARRISRLMDETVQGDLSSHSIADINRRTK